MSGGRQNDCVRNRESAIGPEQRDISRISPDCRDELSGNASAGPVFLAILADEANPVQIEF
jgi:hypothetical protein